jgi:hypothetical protein
MNLTGVQDTASIQECIAAINDNLNKKEQRYLERMEIPALRDWALKGIQTVDVMRDGIATIAISSCLNLPCLIAVYMAMNSYFSCFMSPPGAFSQEEIDQRKNNLNNVLTSVNAELGEISAANTKKEVAEAEAGVRIAAANARKAEADAVASERQTRNWLWRIFN